jgi:hypothetical protein
LWRNDRRDNEHTGEHDGGRDITGVATTFHFCSNSFADGARVSVAAVDEIIPPTSLIISTPRRSPRSFIAKYPRYDSAAIITTINYDNKANEDMSCSIYSLWPIPGIRTFGPISLLDSALVIRANEH